MNRRRHPLRVAVRLLRLAGIVLSAGVDFALRIAFRNNGAALPARALWLQRHSRRALNILKVNPRVAGPVPSRGLLISNHLGYLDVLVISAITPAVFVSKHDVKFWPVFGQLAQMAGTLFVDRARRTQVGRVNDKIEAAVDQGVLVVLFPEGTSSNGEGVLPFKSALLEPAARRAQPLSVGCIQYALADGDVREDVCYWGNHTFFPHLLNLLGKPTVHATVRFAPVASPAANRKELARTLREEILWLKTADVS